MGLALNSWRSAIARGGKRGSRVAMLIRGGGASDIPVVGPEGLEPPT